MKTETNEPKSPEKIRLLHVVESLEVGGAERLVVEMANRASDKIAPHICCFKTGGFMDSMIRHHGIPIYEFNKKPGNDYSLPFQLARLIKKQDISILQTHGWNIFCESAVAAILSGVPAFVHIDHGRIMIGTAHSTKQKIKTSLRHWVEKILIHRVDNIVAVSEDLKQLIMFELHQRPEKIRVIINGTHVPDQSPVIERREREAAANDRSVGIICSVGRLAPVKDHGTLLKAMREVVLKRPDAKLIMIGDGPENANLQKMAKELGIESSIQFLGDIDDVELQLRNADLFVNSSLFEGTSVAILEAMASGLPVIATRVGGNGAIIRDGENGILVPPEKPEAIAEQIILLLENSDLRFRLGEAAYRDVKDHYNVQNFIRQYEDLYFKILSGRNRL